MKVWIVQAGMDYEGTHVVGVCSTEDKAEKLRDKTQKESGYDWADYREHGVDAHEPDFSHFT